MKDEDKTKEQLIKELRQQIADLESAEIERKRSEEILYRSEERFRALTENTSDWIWEVDQSFVFTYVSPKVKDLLGYEPNEVIGKTPFDLMLEHDARRISEIAQSVLASRKSFTALENINLHKDGRQVILETSGIPIFDKDGNFAGYRGIDRDITKRKQAEEALLESEERFRLIAETIDEVFWMADVPNEKIFYISPGYERIWRRTRQSLYENPRSFIDAIHPDDREQVFAYLKVQKTGQPFDHEYRIISPDGSIQWIWDHGFPIRGEKGQVTRYVGVAHNITERKRAEEALHISEEKYRLVVENANDAIFIVQNERIKFPNRQMLVITGYNEEELKSLPFFSFIHADDKDMVMERHRRRLQGENVPATYSFRISNKSGGIVWVEASVVLVTWEGGPAALVFLRDITFQKKLEEQLFHAQKMEAIGTLAGGVAHDFNNLLMGILGYTSLMLMKTDKSHPFYEKLKIIEQQVESGTQLTKQLLGFARGGKYEVKPVNVNDLIIKTSDIFSRTKKEITIHKKLQEDLYTIEADTGQIEQVLFNLYVNAWQAMPSGGRLYLETQNVNLDEQQCRAYNVEPGTFIKISVTDTGIGMDAKTQKRIFEPFFSTKGVGKGTGLGLASAYGIIKNHGGDITVYSEKGRGTTFTIYLPASEAKPSKTRPSQIRLFTGDETIMIVDDEPINIAATKELLEELGYRIMTAQSGPEAIKLFKEHSKDIKLVILDMIMPQMNGKEILVKLMKIDKNVRVLLSSGYNIDGEAAEILDMGCKGFIQKPFRPEEISQKIREVLDRGDS